MKKMHLNRFALILALACFALFAAYPGTADANAPREVKLAYDASTQMLQATITHGPFSGFHYLKTVEVKKNGQVVDEHQFTGQSAETFTYSVKVPAAPGDVLEVKASCSILGSKTEKLKVEPAAAK
jgi:hypothetical protein